MKDLIIKTTPIIISLLPVLLVLLLTKTNTIPPPKYFPALLFVKPRAFPNPLGAVRRPPPDDASLIFFGVLIFIFGPSALRVRVRPAPPPRVSQFFKSLLQHRREPQHGGVAPFPRYYLTPDGHAGSEPLR